MSSRDVEEAAVGRKRGGIIQKQINNTVSTALLLLVARFAQLFWYVYLFILVVRVDFKILRVIDSLTDES